MPMRSHRPLASTSLGLGVEQLILQGGAAGVDDQNYSWETISFSQFLLPIWAECTKLYLYLMESFYCFFPWRTTIFLNFIIHFFKHLHTDILSDRGRSA